MVKQAERGSMDFKRFENRCPNSPTIQALSAALPPLRGLGADVISETRALPNTVIPAKAGIYSASRWKCAADGLDSRFRGNDPCFDSW